MVFGWGTLQFRYRYLLFQIRLGIMWRLLMIQLGVQDFSFYYYATTILQNEILDARVCDILIYPNPTSDLLASTFPAGHVGAEIIFWI